jgi:hypothetical protein
LYRYVGNDPTNLTDPTGLRAMETQGEAGTMSPDAQRALGSILRPSEYDKESIVDVSPTGPFQARFLYCSYRKYYGSPAQFDKDWQTLHQATYQAAIMISKAAELLTNPQYRAIWYGMNTPPNAQQKANFLWVLGNPQQLEKWTARFRDATDQLKNPRALVWFDNNPDFDTGRGTLLYTGFWALGEDHIWGIQFTRGMVVTKNFWTDGAKAYDVAHELGRYLERIGGQEELTNKTKPLSDWQPISIWDEIIKKANEQYFLVKTAAKK